MGAGVAGLTAARELVRHGLSVAVVEARDRIGGRVHTIRDFCSHPVEGGAEFVHTDDAETWPEIREGAPRGAQVRARPSGPVQPRGKDPLVSLAPLAPRRLARVLDSPPSLSRAPAGHVRARLHRASRLPRSGAGAGGDGLHGAPAGHRRRHRGARAARGSGPSTPHRILPSHHRRLRSVRRPHRTRARRVGAAFRWRPCAGRRRA